MMGWGWGDPGAWLTMSLSMLLWVVAAVVVVWLVVRALVAVERRDHPERDRVEPPEEVLRRRLAAGEIDLEEYQRLLTVLRGGTAAQKGGG